MSSLNYLLFFAIFSFFPDVLSQTLQPLEHKDKTPAMYKLGGRLFYGRAIKAQAMEQKIITVQDTDATMRFVAKDAFGSYTYQNLKPTENNKTEAMTQVQQIPNMLVSAKDVLGNHVYENISPIHQHKVILKDEKETVMMVTKTDVFGNFSFENIPSDKNYKIEVALMTDPSIPENEMIYLANTQGDVLKTYSVKDNKDFSYTVLSQDVIKMRLLEEKDVKIQVGEK